MSTKFLNTSKENTFIKIQLLFAPNPNNNLLSNINHLQKNKANLNIILAEIDKISSLCIVYLSDALKGKKSKVEKPLFIILESFE